MNVVQPARPRSTYNGRRRPVRRVLRRRASLLYRELNAAQQLRSARHRSSARRLVSQARRAVRRGTRRPSVPDDGARRSSSACRSCAPGRGSRTCRRASKPAFTKRTSAVAQLRLPVGGLRPRPSPGSGAAPGGTATAATADAAPPAERAARADRRLRPAARDAARRRQTFDVQNGVGRRRVPAVRADARLRAPAASRGSASTRVRRPTAPVRPGASASTRSSAPAERRCPLQPVVRSVVRLRRHDAERGGHRAAATAVRARASTRRRRLSWRRNDPLTVGEPPLRSLWIEGTRRLRRHAVGAHRGVLRRHAPDDRSPGRRCWTATGSAFQVIDSQADEDPLMEDTHVHALDYVSVIRRRKWWLIVPIVASIVVGRRCSCSSCRRSTRRARRSPCVAPGVSPNLVGQSAPLDNQERLRAMSQQLLSPAILARVARGEGAGRDAGRRAARPPANGDHDLGARSGGDTTDEPRRLDTFVVSYVGRGSGARAARRQPAGRGVRRRELEGARSSAPRTRRRSSRRSSRASQVRLGELEAQAAARRRNRTWASCRSRRRRTCRRSPACGSRSTRTRRRCAANRIGCR